MFLINDFTGIEDVGLFGDGGILGHGFVILFIYFGSFLVHSFFDPCCYWWLLCNACFKICEILLDLRVLIAWYGIV